jgi:peptidyl-prolyl cis-trans isomerase D
VLEQLIDQRLMLQEAQRLRLQASPEEVRRTILKIPVLNEGGKWNGDELYHRYVQFSGFASPADYEEALSRDITVGKIESAIANSIVVSQKAADAEYRRNSESARIKYVLYSGVSDPSMKLSAAEVKAFYDANQSKYTHAEQRELKYLVADLARIRMSINPTEQQIRAKYDASKDQYKVAETAHVLHILIKVDPKATPAEDAAAHAKADNIVKQLRAGADFAKLAKENSGDPSSAGNGGDMGYIEKGNYLAPFENAVFSQPVGQISDPIRTPEYGYHIVKVLDRRAPGTRPFDQVRFQIGSQIANEMAQDQAKDEIAKISVRMKEKKPATPVEFSALANERVSSNDTQWFQKGESIPGLGYNQPLATWSFGAKQGDISDVIGTQRGPAIVYVAGIRPAGVSPFDEIKAKVEADAKADRLRGLAKQQLAAAMKGAANIDALAAALKVASQETTVNHSGFVNGIPGDTSALVDTAMNAPAGALQGPVIAGNGAVAFQVIEQKKATPDELAKNRGAFIDSLRQSEARSLRASLLQRLRKSAKIDVNDKVLMQSKGAQQGA